MVGIRRAIGLAVRAICLIIIPSPQESSYRFDDDVTGQQQGSYAQALQGTRLRYHAVDVRPVTLDARRERGIRKLRSVPTAAADQGLSSAFEWRHPNRPGRAP